MIGPAETAGLLSPERFAEMDAALTADMERAGRAAARHRYRLRMAEALATHARNGAPAPNPFRISDNDENFDAITHPCPLDSHLSRESTLIDGLGQKRESDYIEHCMNTAGFIMDADDFAKSVRRRFVRFDQTTRLALALVNGGARKPELRKNAPFILTPISRQAIALPIAPRVNFLPETAASRRAPMLKEVETYLHRNKYARMATFTIGKRTLLQNVRMTHMRLARKLSRLASEAWFKSVAALVFRAIEYGTPQLSARTCEWNFHVHAHTILTPHRFIHKKKWRKYCGRVSRYIHAHWDAGKPVEKPRELVKYPVKPADLEKLLEIGGVAPICEFYRQTTGLRMVETLGTLRTQRSSLKNTKRRRLKERNSEGKWLPTIRRSWNSNGRSTTKAAQRARRERTAATAQFREGMDMIQGHCTLPEPEPLAPKMINRIVARLAPAPFASRVYEPAIFVWNFNGDWKAITEHRCISRMIAAVRPQVELALELCAEADASAGAAGLNSSHQSHNCPTGQLENEMLKPPPDPIRQHLAALTT